MDVERRRANGFDRGCRIGAAGARRALGDDDHALDGGRTPRRIRAAPSSTPPTPWPRRRVDSGDGRRWPPDPPAAGDVELAVQIHPEIASPQPSCSGRRPSRGCPPSAVTAAWRRTSGVILLAVPNIAAQCCCRATRSRRSVRRRARCGRRGRRSPPTGCGRSDRRTPARAHFGVRRYPYRATLGEFLTIEVDNCGSAVGAIVERTGSPRRCHKTV